ncbi:MAG TPA: hypothetical protein VGX52_09880 [Burkholderiales bacterium]|nr:hypothetical protein [Burkholderiales bacterium]
MTQATRNAVIILPAFLVGACVTLGHIQQTKPVRTMNFTGSHKAVAQCLQQRLGGKVHEESFGERYVIYNAVKGMQFEGLTHYAITLRTIGADQGSAEFRIMATPTHGTTTGRTPPPKLSESAVQQFWSPVQDCAARAKGSS